MIDKPGVPFQTMNCGTVFISKDKLDKMQQALLHVPFVLNDLMHRIQILQQNVEFLKQNNQDASELEAELQASLQRYHSLLQSLIHANIIQIQPNGT